MDVLGHGGFSFAMLPKLSKVHCTRQPQNRNLAVTAMRIRDEMQQPTKKDDDWLAVGGGDGNGGRFLIHCVLVVCGYPVDSSTLEFQGQKTRRKFAKSQAALCFFASFAPLLIL